MGKAKKIKKITSGLLASAMLITSYGALADFDDVQTSDWFYNSVTNAEKVGIISGKSDNKFDPQANLTVAEAITLTAKTRAYYNGELEELDGKQSSGHWVQKYADYINSQDISSSDFSPLYDTSITRGMMADLFACALPDDQYESKRDFSYAPEQTDNTNVRKLYESGIMSGDEKGFRLYDNITRAEVSALIDRLINPEDRDFNVDNTKIAEDTTSQRTSDIGKIEAKSTTIYVKGRKMSYSPTDGYTPIKTVYNHTYGCQTQEEYDAVINAVQEAYSAVTNPNRTLSTAEKIMLQEHESVEAKLQAGTLSQSEIKQNSIDGIVAAFPDDIEKQIAIIDMQFLAGQISRYVQNNFAVPQGQESKTISAYDYIFTTEYSPTCEGISQFNMAIYDVMGYNSAIYGSQIGNHASAAVELYGVWMGAFKEYTFRPIEDIKSGTYTDLKLFCYATNSDKIEGSILYTIEN